MEFQLSLSLFNLSCPFAITSLICCEITSLYKSMAKSMGKGKLRPPVPTAPTPLIDFDEIRTLALSPEDNPPCKISFRSDDVCRVGEYPVCHCH